MGLNSPRSKANQGEKNSKGAAFRHHKSLTLRFGSQNNGSIGVDKHFRLMPGACNRTLETKQNV
jgi:hypothetical protein